MTLTPERLEELERQAQRVLTTTNWAGFDNRAETVLELITEIRRLQGEVERLREALEQIVNLPTEDFTIPEYAKERGKIAAQALHEKQA